MSILRRATALAAMLAIPFAGCERVPEVRSFSGPTMGSSYTVKYVADIDQAALQRVVEATLADFDAAFSKWRDDSELERCNAALRAGEPHRGTPRFCAVLELALELAAATDGAFDPTVGPLLAIYREAKANGIPLDPAKLDAASARVGYARVTVEGGTVRAPAGTQLDLDGIVAGACLDELDRRIVAFGLSSFYLDVTGEIWCRGEKAPGSPWQIGVEDPTAAALGRREPFAVLPLREQSMCMSGNYRNAFTADGERAHHVFDPRTGRSATSRVVSCSVIGPSAAVADALGTALLVLGEERGVQVIERLRERLAVSALLFVADDDAGRVVRCHWPD